jgi:AraC family transcriptional regulator
MRKTDIFNDLSEHVSLRIHSCQASFHDRQWFEDKIHGDYDFWFITSGEIRIQTASKSHCAKPGDVIFFYPNEPYTAGTGANGCEFVYIHFDFAIGEQFRILDDYDLSGIVPGNQIGQEARHFLGAHQQYQNNESMSSIRLKGTLYVFLAKVIELYEKGVYTGLFRAKRSTNGHVQNMTALQPIFAHIQTEIHRSISIGELASIAGMSEKYFITYFKKTVGVTPGQYIFQLKMNKARDYLYQKKYAVKHIASMLGYPDPYTFSKAFKKFYHTPPSRFV